MEPGNLMLHFKTAPNLNQGKITSSQQGGRGRLECGPLHRVRKKEIRCNEGVSQ